MSKKFPDISNFSNLSKDEIIYYLKNFYCNDKSVSLSYSGKTDPWDIVRLVKPKMQKTLFHYGEEHFHNKNYIYEGENLSTMITLYKFRGQVDLIITDPPYNTGKDFRYNDKWDTNPDDPDLGNLVSEDDGSKHSKWLRFMAPRLYMMKEMLKPEGVIAICIDHRELYRLGILMDEIFGEKHRIGIINWQKNYSPKSGSDKLSQSTEYVLIYAKEINKSTTFLEARTQEMNNRYSNPDFDINGAWLSDNAVAKDSSNTTTFGIQSPFTGKLYYPNENRGHWGQAEKTIKNGILGWNVEYCKVETSEYYFVKNKQNKLFSYFIKGWDITKDISDPYNQDVLDNARKKALIRLQEGNWPSLIWGKEGKSGPRLKTYLKDVKNGKVPMTFWSNNEFDTFFNEPLILDSMSWNHNESGHSQSGMNELDSILGKGHGFETIKPLKLIKKIISLWCPPEGLVFDPFAGSGTTAHACLELNKEFNFDRRFILIEQGNTETGDYYAKTLTAKRIKNVISGEYASIKKEPILSGFTYKRILKRKVDPEAVTELAKEELIEVLTTSYWNGNEKSKSYLKKFYCWHLLFAINQKNEGFYLVWDGQNTSDLTKQVFLDIIREGKKYNLEKKYHIYATSSTYDSPNIEFYKIPDKVLEQLGFNENISE